MKTVQQIVTILLLFTYTSILFGCKKDDASSSSEIINTLAAQNCLITKINSDAIRYNADSSIYTYGDVYLKRFGDTLYSQFYGMPFNYLVFDKLNRPVTLRPYYDKNSKTIYTYVGETNKLSSIESFNYSYDSLDTPVLSYYYKMNFAYLGDKITSASYEFKNLSKDVQLLKGTLSYTYLNKYTDSRTQTFQKLLVLGSNPILEMTQFSKYPVSKIIDSQHNFNTNFTYEFDANGKITKQIMNSSGIGNETTTYSYSCK